MRHERLTKGASAAGNERCDESAKVTRVPKCPLNHELMLGPTFADRPHEINVEIHVWVVSIVQGVRWDTLDVENYRLRLFLHTSTACSTITSVHGSTLFLPI